ncbi:MAG: hypothetical protein J6C91_07480 [Muribaculaceae bacterium]|nr:hypothetical protein [Muribaculaceae bacterium]
MEKQESTHDRIELRSEKVRKILGDIPRGIVVWGYVVLLTVAIGLIILLYFFPEFIGQLTKR